MAHPRLSDRHVWRQILLTDITASGTDLRGRMHEIRHDRRKRAQANEALAQLQNLLLDAYRQYDVLRTDSVIEDYLNLSFIFTDLLTEATDIPELDVEVSTTPLPVEVIGSRREDVDVERARVMIRTMLENEPELTAAVCRAWKQHLKGEASDWLELSDCWFTACKRLDGPDSDINYKQVTYRFMDFLHFLHRTEQALPPPLRRLFG